MQKQTLKLRNKTSVSLQFYNLALLYNGTFKILLYSYNTYIYILCDLSPYIITVNEDEGGDQIFECYYSTYYCNSCFR